MKETTKIQQKIPSPAKKPAVKKPCLIMIEGDYLGEIYPLDQSSVTLIGRDDDADIILSDLGVSRRHAMVERKDQAFVLADLRSTNGTALNGQSVTQSPLNDGDKIHLGSTVLKFCYQDDIDTEYHKQLRNMAIRDGMTRLYNKRFFMDALLKEFKYSQRHGVALSIVMFDVDHFKQLNDTHGHPAGDFVLKRLSNLLEKGIRGYDVFARYGGEEFAFLLRGLSFQAALPFAERIRKLVDENSFSYEDKLLPVTISVGVATFDSDNVYGNEEEFLSMADQSLYVAKKTGRNRVASPLDVKTSS